MRTRFSCPSGSHPCRRPRARFGLRRASVSASARLCNLATLITIAVDGGPGNDTLDGGPDDDVVVQSVGADTVSSGTVAGTRWQKHHVRSVKGKTKIRVGGKVRTLPHAQLDRT